MVDLTPRNDARGWRWYGDKISVTTILQLAVAKPQLMHWLKNNSANKIEKTKEQTAAFGTKTHSLFEAILKGEKPEVPETHKKVVESFNKFITEYDFKPTMIEVRVWSANHGYAGTMDCLGMIKGKLYVIDWKTSRSFSATFGLQLAAYRLAAIEMGIAPPEVGMGIVKFDRETGEPKIFLYEHIEAVEHAYLCALDLFKHLNFHYLKSLGWKWLEERSLKRYAA